MNVYGPKSITDKKKLWEDLLELKRNLNGICVFFDDFNMVRTPDERVNSRFCQYKTSDFNNLIAEVGLHE